MKPYTVWVKQGDWYCLLATHNPTEAKDYANGKITRGNNVERIEIRDLTGVLETIWDRSWS